MLKAVIYDMDGVLIDSEPLWRKALTEVFISIDIPIKEEVGIETMGMRIDKAIKYWHDRLKWNKPDLPTVEKMVMNKVEELIIKSGKPREGAVESLKFFHGQKMKVALASSAHMRVIKAVVNTLKISYYFDLLHSAEHDRHPKPAPDVYLRTAKELGVKPSECLVIEDSPVGVKAAKSARMLTIAIPAVEMKDNEDIQLADYIIRSLVEVYTTLWPKLSPYKNSSE